MKVYIETYGCAFAQAEGEMISGLLERNEFTITHSISDADVIVIVTCHVKETTEKKILYRIKKFGELYPGKALIVYGCLPQAYPEIVKENNPRASIVGNFFIRELPKIVSSVSKGNKIELIGKNKEVKLRLPRVKKNPVVGIIPIAEGCVGNCSYCSTKFSRGTIFSYPEEFIVKEAYDLIKNGCKEIYLTAQDTACYGIDIGTTLPDLIEKIISLPGDFSIRIGMMNPFTAKKILPKLLKVYESEKVYKFLHIPVQSGSDRILRKMNRNYTVSEFIDIVEKFREKFPFVQIWTDIIVGFPGETEEDFKMSIELIEKIKPDWVNVSRFSSRPGTKAAKMKQLPTSIKKERSREISKVVKSVVEEVNKKWIGWEGRILINEKGKGNWVGRNFAYKPVVVESEKNLLGKFVKVRIAQTKNILFGEILDN